MAADTVVQIRNLTKKIGGKTIVDRLTFDVPKGEVFGFLGPNGAGKTTTIRMIVGLITMSEGEVLVNGLSVSKQFEHAMTHIGAIVENPEMYKFLSGYQNLVHYSRMHTGVTRERIGEAVELVGLKNRIHEKVKRYSLGMRQRLGVAQAILHRPSVLILDEPTNGLDPAGIRELRDYLRTLARKENIAVIVSSHLLTEMELLCDRVAIIQAGKLIDVRRVQELREQSGTVRIAFEVDRVSEALRIVREEAPSSAAIATELGVEAQLEREQIPQLVEAFVRENVKLYGIRTHAASLEDKFLEMTGSEQIV